MKQTMQLRFGWFCIIVTFFLLASTVKAAPSPHRRVGTSNVAKPVGVSMVALISVPERYDGKFVRTIGFICIEFEGDALYLHEEDYRHGLTKNSFALRLSDSEVRRFKSLNQKYVLIEGTVYAKGLEKADMWSGAIGNITRLEAWPADRDTPHK